MNHTLTRNTKREQDKERHRLYKGQSSPGGNRWIHYYSATIRRYLTFRSTHFNEALINSVDRFE